MSGRPAAPGLSPTRPYRERPEVRSPGDAWPDGSRLAVYVAVGVEEYRFGQGRVENILDTTARPDFANTSWRDYGNRVGGFRLLDRLASRGITPTVLLNTDVYDSAPDLVAAARAVGAEFVAHGVSNSDTLAGLSPDEELAYLALVADRMEREEGVRPRGWSSPWLEHNEHTFEHLARTGFDHVLDLRMDDRPVSLPTATSSILSVPYALELNDSSTLVGRQQDAGDFARMVVDEFDELLAASEEAPLVMSVVVHSFISGAPFRLAALTRALDHIRAHADRVWLTTPGGIASAVS